jgi:hypothetical protein
LWCDGSNYTQELTDQGCADLKAAGVGGMIAQAITGADGRTFTRQQLDALERNGLKSRGYIWAFPGEGDASIDSRLAMFDGYPILGIGVDVEQDGLSEYDISHLLQKAEAYLARRAIAGLPWFYTAFWYFARRRWLNLTLWKRYPLWDTRYNGRTDPLFAFVPYGGWTAADVVATQYWGTSSIGHVHQIDLDVVA